MGKNVQVRLAKMAAVQRVEKEAMEVAEVNMVISVGILFPKKSSKHLEL